MIKWYTVRQGERVGIWNRHGELEIVDGPKRLWLRRGKLQPLQAFSAGASEYLVIRYTDGHTEHIPGPAAIWQHPVDHEDVGIEQALAINAHEAIVVYRRMKDKVERRVLHGPLVYVPTEDEWLHEFRWHGADPIDPRRKIPRALTFTELRTIPDQMYFDVEEVRTSDDALLAIKLMIFFELADVEKMLDRTHDPIADFINSVTADIVEFVGRRTFEKFKQETDLLNDLETYRNLTQRGESIGYNIRKVVYRGYTAGAQLQAMHDSAIEARTQLQLQADTERQAQELADLKLEREGLRAEELRKLEEAKAEHMRRLKRLEHEESLHQSREECEQKARSKRMLNEIELEHLKARNQERVQLLGAMRGMQVDLTQYLVSQYRHPDRLIRIDGGDRRAQVHLHQQ